MKFLVDVCAGKSVHQWLIGAGHDAVSVAEFNPKLSDPEILEWAVREKRILITLDKDFQKLAFLAGRPHAGIIRLPNVHRAGRVELVRTVVERHSEDLLKGAVITVKPGRIRITRAVK